MKEMAKSRALQLLFALLCSSLPALLVCAQDTQMVSPHVKADPKNAQIEGRVRLPSGHSAEINVRITLRNTTSTLNTLYSNKHGEFRFSDLSEGIYLVEAAGDANLYEPAVETVRLGRGQVFQLTISLRPKMVTVTRRAGPLLVSAKDLREDAPAEARKEYDRGAKLMAKGDWNGASAHLRRALEIHPDYRAARNDLGAQCLKLGLLDEAAEHFRMILGKDPKYFNARFNLALVMIERKQYAEAQAQLKEALQIDPTRAVGHLWLGIIHLNTGDLQGAERELTRALIMGSPELAEAHYYLAQVYLKRGDPAEAGRAFRAYLDESPKGEFAEEAKAWLKTNR